MSDMPSIEALRSTMKFSDGSREPEPEVVFDRLAPLPANASPEAKAAFGQALLRAGFDRSAVEAHIGQPVTMPETAEQRTRNAKAAWRQNWGNDITPYKPPVEPAPTESERKVAAEKERYRDAMTLRDLGMKGQK